jgi:ABC transport system ATP-binding/permease protein
VLLVSHDRRFLDEVVTQTLAADGDGVWREYVGGYGDWLAQRPRPAAVAGAAPAAAAPAAATAARPAGRTTSKLSFRESRELAQLPLEIEALEQEHAAILERMSGPDYHRQGGERMRADRLRIAAIAERLPAAYERWAELEARAASPLSSR